MIHSNSTSAAGSGKANVSGINKVYKDVTSEEALTKIYLDKAAIGGIPSSQQMAAKKVPKAYLQKVLADNNRSKSTKINEINP